MRHLANWRESLKQKYAEYKARTEARLGRQEEIIRYRNSVAGKKEHLKELEKKWIK